MTSLTEIEPATPAQNSAQEESFLAFLVKLVIIVAIIRIFFLSSFNIPSESMQPRLLIGDYLFANRAAYGWSRYTLPFAPDLPAGRILGSLPERGDVVIFRAPPANRQDWIKRVIGLPGDRIQLVDGVVFVNDRAIPRRRIADLVIPVSANMVEASFGNPCFRENFEVRRNGRAVACRYPRFRETLAGGRSYDVLDLIVGDADTTGIYEVPEGHVFLMGDNRDRSYDSRFPAVDGGGIGIVPMDNVVGEAWFTIFSTDGSATWSNPVSWFAAARWERIGVGF